MVDHPDQSPLSKRQGESLTDLKARVDARIVVAELLGPGKHSGQSIRYSGDQIGVGGDNPTRFSITETGFTDWRDGTGGDVIALIALIQGFSYIEAADW